MVVLKRSIKPLRGSRGHPCKISWTLDFSKIKKEKDSEWLDDRW